ncbi:MAG: metallophosphoesterase [bacterium]
MFDKNINLKITTSQKVLVVSDIHLQLPLTNELSIIQQSLVGRINELATHKQAILVLNGDILELWAQSDQSVEDIIAGYTDLKAAILNFNKKPGHRVIYTVGNHDDVLAVSASDRAVVANHWRAEVCNTLNLAIGRRTIRIEHGHENDSYNKTSPARYSHGKKLVQNTLPMLLERVPILVSGIGDVVDRSFLASFVLSNLLYKLIIPFSITIVLFWAVYQAVVNSNARYVAATALVLLMSWLAFIVMDVLVRLVARQTLGGGKKYMRSLDKYQKEAKFDALVLGHTHDGKVEKRSGYSYANSGCNDIIALPRTGWLVIPRFSRYIQMSEITIDYSKKEPIKYHQQIITLVK